MTDVSGVKAPVVAAVDHPRFVGGHPMAGSEQAGLDGADPELFTGATWVLTPTPTTDLDAFSAVQAVVVSLGADVVALAPERARPSGGRGLPRAPPGGRHPHELGRPTRPRKDAALLRLAAGGFRDMTRVAAGQPGIWPDVCADNAAAIVAAFDQLLADLADMRRRVADGDRPGLLEVLQRASTARRVPAGPGHPARAAGRAAGAGARPPGRAGRDHHPGRRPRASTSPTSRSPTPPRARGACSSWWSTAPRAPGCARR